MQFFYRKEFLCLVALWPIYALGFCTNQTLNAMPYPHDCQAFILCLFSKPYLQTCHDGLFFDVQTNDCQPIANALCCNTTVPIMLILPIFERATFPDSTTKILLSTSSTLKMSNETNTTPVPPPSTTSNSNLHTSSQSEFHSSVAPTLMTATAETSLSKSPDVNSNITTEESLKTETTSETSTYLTTSDVKLSSVTVMNLTTSISTESSTNGSFSTDTDQFVMNITETSTVFAKNLDVTGTTWPSTTIASDTSSVDTEITQITPSDASTYEVNTRIEYITKPPDSTTVSNHPSTFENITEEPKLSTKLITSSSSPTYIPSTLPSMTTSNINTSYESTMSTETKKASSIKIDPEEQYQSTLKVTSSTTPQTSKLSTVLLTSQTTPASDITKLVTMRTLSSLPPSTSLPTTMKSTSTNKIISTTSSSVPTEKPPSPSPLSDFSRICTLKNIFLFPDPTDCRSYFYCFFEDMTRIKCKYGYEFNPYLLECVPQLKGNCYKMKLLEDQLEFVDYFIKFHKLYKTDTGK